MDSLSSSTTSSTENSISNSRKQPIGAESEDATDEKSTKHAKDHWRAGKQPEYDTEPADHSIIVSSASSDSESESDTTETIKAKNAADAMTSSASEKCSCNSTGTVLLASSVVGLTLGILAFLTAADIIQRAIDVDGKPVKRDGYILSGIVLSVLSIASGVVGSIITVYCRQTD